MSSSSTTTTEASKASQKGADVSKRLDISGKTALARSARRSSFGRSNPKTSRASMLAAQKINQHATTTKSVGRLESPQASVDGNTLSTAPSIFSDSSTVSTSTSSSSSSSSSVAAARTATEGLSTAICNHDEASQGDVATSDPFDRSRNVVLARSARWSSFGRRNPKSLRASTVAAQKANQDTIDTQASRPESPHTNVGSNSVSAVPSIVSDSSSEIMPMPSSKTTTESSRVSQEGIDASAPLDKSGKAGLVRSARRSSFGCRNLRALRSSAVAARKVNQGTNVVNYTTSEGPVIMEDSISDAKTCFSEWENSIVDNNGTNRQSRGLSEDETGEQDAFMAMNEKKQQGGVGQACVHEASSPVPNNNNSQHQCEKTSLRMPEVVLSPSSSDHKSFTGKERRNRVEEARKKKSRRSLLLSKGNM